MAGGYATRTSRTVSIRLVLSTVQQIHAGTKVPSFSSRRRGIHLDYRVVMTCFRVHVLPSQQPAVLCNPIARLQRTV